MIEVAVELVEAVHGRQELVAIAEMVLAELAGGVTERLEHLGQGRVLLLNADGGAGEADLGQPGANRGLTRDKGGASRGTALLRIVVGKEHALGGDAVDIGCVIARHPPAVAAEIGNADIVGHDHEDIGFFGCGDCTARHDEYRTNARVMTKVKIVEIVKPFLHLHLSIYWITTQQHFFGVL